MPVSLENLQQPNTCDLNDLGLIYQDYPALTCETKDIPLWIERQLEQNQQLFVGRFNGRLLAAVWVTGESNHWQLQHLCVRNITRRRGTAKQLLSLLKHHAQSEQKLLVVKGELLDHASQALLAASGFDYNSDSHLWAPATQPS